LTLFPAVVQLLNDKGLADVKVFGGGIIPPDDISKLKAQGVAELFTPGTSTKDIVLFIKNHISPRPI